MPITLDEIKELREGKRKSDNNIGTARVHEDRVRMHSQMTFSRQDTSPAFPKFMRTVKGRLPNDKYKIFENTLGFPLATVSFSDTIYKAHHKVFDGRNPVYIVNTTVPDYRIDFQDYRNNTLKLQQMWETVGFEVMKLHINSIAIVDLPAEQTTERPEPFVYFLDIRQKGLLYSHKDGTQLDWIIFEKNNDELCVIDDESYRIYSIDGSGNVKGDAIVDSPHDLGHCPAHFFWTTAIDYTKPDVKQSIITPYLFDMDQLLYFGTGNEHLNDYARWPIIWAFKSKCRYKDHEGNYCKNGMLYNKHHVLLKTDGGTSDRECPGCKKNRFDGAGTYLGVNPPSQENDKADLREPVGWVNAPVETLEYNIKDLKRRADKVYTATTGYMGMVNKEAINEPQVLAVLQSMESAIANTQKNFERIMRWVDETIFKLRYGSDALQSISVSLGTEHYIMTSAQVMELYAYAKEHSFSASTLDILEDRYFYTEFRNNPEQLMRYNLSKNLDPLRHLSNDEVNAMYSEGSIGYADYLVKINFSSLLARFERDNLPIEDFGVGLEFGKRVEVIKEALYVYAAEMQPESNNNVELENLLNLYAIAVRAGAITPQSEDEAAFRAQLSTPEMSANAVSAWEQDGGIRRPITLKSQTEAQQDAGLPNNSG